MGSTRKRTSGGKGGKSKASAPTFLDNWLMNDAGPVNEKVGSSVEGPVCGQKRTYPDEIPDSEDEDMGSLLENENIPAPEGDKHAELSPLIPAEVNEPLTSTTTTIANASGSQENTSAERPRSAEEPDTRSDDEFSEWSGIAEGEPEGSFDDPDYETDESNLDVDDVEDDLAFADDEVNEAMNEMALHRESVHRESAELDEPANGEIDEADEADDSASVTSEVHDIDVDEQGRVSNF